MEQHGRELDYQNKSKEEYEHQSDGLQLKVLLGDVHLWGMSNTISGALKELILG